MLTIKLKEAECKENLSGCKIDVWDRLWII